MKGCNQAGAMLAAPSDTASKPPPSPRCRSLLPLLSPSQLSVSEATETEAREGAGCEDAAEAALSIASLAALSACGCWWPAAAASGCCSASPARGSLPSAAAWWHAAPPPLTAAIAPAAHCASSWRGVAPALGAERLWPWPSGKPRSLRSRLLLGLRGVALGCKASTCCCSCCRWPSSSGTVTKSASPRGAAAAAAAAAAVAAAALAPAVTLSGMHTCCAGLLVASCSGAGSTLHILIHTAE